MHKIDKFNSSEIKVSNDNEKFFFKVSYAANSLSDYTETHTVINMNVDGNAHASNFYNSWHHLAFSAKNINSDYTVFIWYDGTLDVESSGTNSAAEFIDVV